MNANYRRLFIANLQKPIGERVPVHTLVKREELNKINSKIFAQVHAEIEPSLQAIRKLDEIFE